MFQERTLSISKDPKIKIVACSLIVNRVFCYVRLQICYPMLISFEWPTICIGLLIL